MTCIYMVCQQMTGPFKITNCPSHFVIKLMVVCILCYALHDKYHV